MIEFARYLTVACCLFAIIVGTPQWWRWFRDYSPEVMQGRLALAALNVAVGYGTYEVLARDIPGGPRTYLTAVGALWAAYTVAWQPVTDLIHRILRRTHVPAPARPAPAVPSPRAAADRRPGRPRRP